jgi:hypothetical protein
LRLWWIFFFPAHRADDKVFPMGGSGMKNPDDELIHDLTFTNSIYLYELAVLAFAVHEANTSYLLVSNNCYHFAGTITKLLEMEHNTMNIVDGANAGK